MQYMICNEHLVEHYSTNDTSLAPTQEGDGAVDLRACIDEPRHCLLPGESLMIPTGLKTAIPLYWCGLLLPRSGIPIKHSVKLANDIGFIDSNFRQEIMVVLKNEGDEEFRINRLDRIAQLAIVPHYNYHKLVRVSYLYPTIRGNSKGFGSSGRT